jgi:hypothetical protein
MFAAGPGSGVGLFIQILFVVVIAIFLWAVFIRKQKTDHAHGKHHWRSSRSRSEKSESSEDTEGGKGFFGGKKRRRKRRKNRPTNPTLAETGGLPPIRSDDVDASDKN